MAVKYQGGKAVQMNKPERLDYARKIRQARSLVTDVAAGESSYQNLTGPERILLGEAREKLEAVERMFMRT